MIHPNEIKDLTITFFKTIDSTIIEKNGIYKITIPGKYQNIFGQSQIIFTFDEQIASEYNCELIIPGSKTLFQIITNCINKGPICLKQTKNHGMNFIIRYHFYVNFMGSRTYSQLFYIDVDLQTLSSIQFDEPLEPGAFQLAGKIKPEIVTASYKIAIEELLNKSTKMKSSFLDTMNVLFQKDFKLFITKYDSEIRELDQTINQKEKTTDDFNKMQKFRFETLEQINHIEQEKLRLINTLQEKHKIIMDYSLIGCEIVLI